MKTKERKERRQNNKQNWRNKMNATKLTIIVLAAAAIMFGGCSNDNRVLSPGADFQSEAGITSLNRTGSDSDSKFDNNESAPGQESFTILAKVMMLDIESGCWYLQADDGKSYTPVSPKDLVLESGLKLKAEGYIDENIQFFCGNGPAFVIENYEVIGKAGERESEGANESTRSGSGSAADEGGMALNSLEGIVNVTKEGCLILNTTDKDEFVLQHDTDAILEKGDHIAVTGYVSALPVITCYEAPVFYAETISKFNESKEADRSKDEMASVTEDDNDRYMTPSEDRPQDENLMDREREEKKKFEAEGNSGKSPREEAAPAVPADNSDTESFVRSSDDRYSQDELMERQLEEKKKREVEGSYDKSSKEDAAPAMPADNSDTDESFDRSSEDRYSQDDLTDQQLEEIKKNLDAEENGKDKGNDGP